MDSAAFKYKTHYQQQQQQQQQHEQQSQHQQHFNSSSGNDNNNSYYNHNNNNKQNSIFILNTTTNSILPNNNLKLFYSDLNENNVVSSSSSSSQSYSNTTADASSSMWLSASSTMCSPAAHAIQKLFNCSSTSLKSNQGNYKGIETKSNNKTKSELLKKKNKIWKYLEGEEEEANVTKNNQIGFENETKEKLKEVHKKSFKYKTKFWLKSSCESDNQNNQDLAELLEYSCSLCDNCQCIDCQIAYFDCDNSDDSNSEYSCHLSAYEEDDDTDECRVNKSMELITTEEKLKQNLINMDDNDCHETDNELQDQLEPKNISNCAINEGCQQCLLEERASKNQ